MRKKRLIFLGIVVIIILLAIIAIRFILKNSKLEYWIEEVKELNYFTILSNNKIGVINKNRRNCNRCSL